MSLVEVDKWTLRVSLDDSQIAQIVAGINNAAITEISKLKEALEFYATERNWSWNVINTHPEYAGRDCSLGVVQCDHGQRARDALKGDK